MCTASNKCGDASQLGIGELLKPPNNILNDTKLNGCKVKPIKRFLKKEFGVAGLQCSATKFGASLSPTRRYAVQITAQKRQPFSVTGLHHVSPF